MPVPPSCSPSSAYPFTFDPRHDHLTAYTFDSNPLGVQGDMQWFEDTRSSTDYDAIWEVRTAMLPDGCCVIATGKALVVVDPREGSIRAQQKS